MLEKYHKLMDEQLIELETVHGRNYNRSELRTYNLSVEALSQSSQLRRQPKS